MLLLFCFVFGDQGWPSGKSTRLSPMWPEFESWRPRHMWAEFIIGSLPCSERFLSGYSGFPLSLKTSPSKFKFDLGRTHTFKRLLKPPKYFVGKQTNKYKLNYKYNFVCFVFCLFACLLFLWLFCTISFFSFQTFVLRKIRDNAADNVSDAFPGIYVHERKQCNVKKTYSRSILTLCYTMISFYFRSCFSFFCSW